MASSNKTSHGLNKWGPNDTPQFADHTADNQKINDETLWRTDYDATGEVRLAGGIKAYVQKFYDSIKDSFVTLATPTGEIKMYAANDVPTGFLPCNGQAVSRTTYAKLFTVIGTIYGVGDGTTTFNVPDMRDRFPKGADGNTGSKGGAASIKLTVAQLPTHTPAVKQYSATPQATDTSYANFVYGKTWATSGQGFSPIGSGQAVDILPSFLATPFIIKT